MWKHIVEGITGPIVEELILPAKREWNWRRAAMETGILLGLFATCSWLIH